MSGIILRLAGPLQSWGERSAFGERDSAAFPTRSGLIGLLESAQGHPRGHKLDDYREVEFTIRVDRPGVRLVDFHTIGGGLPTPWTVPTAAGKRRSEGTATIVSRRHYLADAAFTVAVTGPPPVTGRLAAALRRPVWAPYLGRRSCPPDAPLVLCEHIADPVAELLTRVPLARRRPRDVDTVEVDVIYERPPTSEVRDTAVLELTDVPETFAPRSRRYLTRTLWIQPHRLPADLCAGRDGTDVLLQYVEGVAS